MKLSFDTIKEIVTGAAAVKEENGNIVLNRFTDAQEELYRVRSDDLYQKTFSAAGIRLSFATDSEKMLLKLKTSASSSRKYFSVDVFADGKPIDYIDNYSHLELPTDYTKMNCELGEFSKEFSLGKGAKNVCVYMPWSVKTEICEISVDDNAFIRAVKPEKKLLAFGDSITHGYDALRPSNRYASRLADMLEAEEFNKAIGAEIFFPGLAKAKDDFTPDYITVAYGTNDWSKTDEDTFKRNCTEFYSNLASAYPTSKIFAITPIWRKDRDDYRPMGEFERVEQIIKSVTADFENITVISGVEFVPHDEKYYADLRLHPNDKGFEYYADALYKKIMEIPKNGTIGTHC